MTPVSEHQVAVWIDQHEARVFRVDKTSFDETTFKAPGLHVKRHSEQSSKDHAHDEAQHRFFHDVAVALHAADQIIVLGPSKAKLHFVKWVHTHDKALEPRIIGLETVDHPTDPQVAAYARTYFRAAERMQGATPQSS